MRRLTLWLILFIVVVIALIAFIVLGWAQPIPLAVAEQAQFTANKSDQAGVDVSSSFSMVFDAEIGAASINKYLTVEPSFEMGIHQGNSPYEILLVPAAPLEADTVYVFTLLTEEGEQLKWAFQTQKPYQIAAAIPADRALGVSLSATIDIFFNQMTDIDLARCAEYISIEPELEGSFSQNGRMLRFTPDERLAPNTVYTVRVAAAMPLVDSSLTLEQGYSFAFETADANGQPLDPQWAISAPAACAVGAAPEIAFTVLKDAAAAEPAQDDADEDESAPQLTYTVYAYTGAEQYAAALLDIAAAKPSWSLSGQYLSGSDISGLSRVYSGAIDGETLHSSGKLPLAQTLPAGYYLLRAAYLGETRDLLFAVSDLDACYVAAAGRSLLWLHRRDGSAVEPAQIVDYGGDGVYYTDQQGLAELPAAGGQPTAYIVYSGEDDTVILAAAQQWPELSEYANWRCFFTDKDIYQNGDNVYYWGLLRPRDGSALEYQRVSVLLFNEQGGDWFYREYAALEDDLFHGAIALPQLLDGEYRLEIWQSGQRLLGKVISVGQTAAATTTAATAQTAEPLQISSDGALSDGGSFSARFTQAGQEYLFYGSDLGILGGRVVNTDSVDSVFAPKNKANRYMTAIAYEQGRYTASATTAISLDPELRRLRLEVDVRDGSAYITVEDSAGMAMNEARVIVQLLYDGQPLEEAALDVAAAIYCDHSPSLTAAPVYTHQLNIADAAQQQQTAAVDGQTLLYHWLSAEEAAAGIALPLQLGGDYQLLVQVVDTQGELLGGSHIERLTVDGEPPAETAEQGEQPDTRQAYTYSGLMKAEEAAQYDSAALAIISGSAERALLLDSLLAAAFAGGAAADDEDEADSGGGAEIDAATAVAAAHARQLLFDYGGDYFAGVLAGGQEDVGGWQNADGGIGAGGISDLRTSVLAAAAAPQGVSYAALGDYFESYLCRAASEEQQLAALCGLATLGRVHLNEMRQFIGRELSVEQALWLIWGLRQANDRVNAERLLNELLTATSALSGADAEIQVLAAVCCAYAGADQQALQILLQLGASEQGTTDGRLLERVLAARTLLNQTTQPEADFIYNIGERQYQGHIGGIQDQLIRLAVAETLAIDSVQPLYVCLISTARP
ncbi:MAG: Ig-like domain-containing protein [Bacillota bacterium]|nr:Ig-like domain-containing protein [Bacillota bacterium]